MKTSPSIEDHVKHLGCEQKKPRNPVKWYKRNSYLNTKATIREAKTRLQITVRIMMKPTSKKGKFTMFCTCSLN